MTLNCPGNGAVALLKTSVIAAASDADELEGERNGIKKCPAYAATGVVMFNSTLVKLGNINGRPAIPCPERLGYWERM
jgi:hypothetical protein